jgi:hypothetical protein
MAETRSFSISKRGDVRKLLGMRLPNVRRAQDLVREHEHELMAAWLAWDAKRRERANGAEKAH